MGPLEEGKDHLVLADLVVEGNWDVSKVSIQLPDDFIDRILSMSTPSITRNDLLILAFVTHQSFSLALAYKAQLPPINPTIDLS